MATLEAFSIANQGSDLPGQGLEVSLRRRVSHGRLVLTAALAAAFGIGGFLFITNSIDFGADIAGTPIDGNGVAEKVRDTAGVVGGFITTPAAIWLAGAVVTALVGSLTTGRFGTRRGRKVMRRIVD